MLGMNGEQVANLIGAAIAGIVAIVLFGPWGSKPPRPKI